MYSCNPFCETKEKQNKNNKTAEYLHCSDHKSKVHENWAWPKRREGPGGDKIKGAFSIPILWVMNCLAFENYNGNKNTKSIQKFKYYS